MTLKLTRERMILAGLLVAAGCGWAADQLVFADAAPDAVNEFARPGAASNAAAKTPKPAPTSPEQILATRLQQLAGAAPELPDAIRDPFSPASIARTALASDISMKASPWSKRVLNGVLFGAEGRGVAIVDGRMIPVGSRVDGLQLIRVTKTMAVFGDGATSVTLTISQRPVEPN